MADLTDRYALLLAAGQAQKEVTHNAAVAAIDALLHLAVVSRTATTPPVAPAAGSAWIVGPSPTGAWAGAAGRIAVFDASGWSFVAPRAGCLAYVVDDGLFAVFTATGWAADAWPVAAIAVDGRRLLAARPATLADASGGTVVDTEARAAIAALTDALRAMGLVAPV